MKQSYTGILSGIVMALILVLPAFSQQESWKHNNYAAYQDPASMTETGTSTIALLGIPPTLIDVRYRNCPVRRRKVNPKNAAIFEGKVYHFSCDQSVAKFWENPQSIVAGLKNTSEVPLNIVNIDGKCPVNEKPASREYFRINRDTIVFFCSSKCRDTDKRTRRRNPVSRQKVPVTTGD
ncbi:MAG: hypothetical protein HQM10_12005 [Candidatus Riflebacteria bacterium]|nr:hypothetical protein [Candidatus Riflebacteria bacterium]